MHKIIVIVIVIGVMFTVVVIAAVQVGRVMAQSEATQRLKLFRQYVIDQGVALGQGTLDDVVAVLHSDLPTAGSSYFPGYYTTGFGYGFRFLAGGNGAYGTGGTTTQMLCSVNWQHNASGAYAWQGFVTVSQGDCETDQPITRLVLSLDASSTQTLNVGDLIETFGAPIAVERPSSRPCVSFRIRLNSSGANGASVNGYNAASNFFAPGLQLYFADGFSALIPCYAGAQTTLTLESPIRALTYSAPLPTPSSAPFSYPAAQWRGLAVPSRYYAMCSATDDPRCQARRLPRGGQNGFYNSSGAPPPSLFPTFVPPP